MKQTKFHTLRNGNTEWALHNTFGEPMVCWVTPQLHGGNGSFKPHYCTNVCPMFKHTDIDLDLEYPTTTVILYCSRNNPKPIDCDVIYTDPPRQMEDKKGTELQLKNTMNT